MFAKIDKNYQIEILELKNTVDELKNAIEIPKSRPDQVKQRNLWPEK